MAKKEGIKMDVNVKVYSENVENKAGFNIILDMSGRREFLMYHRHNGLLYRLLKNGVRLEELRRWKPRKRDSRRGQQAQTKVFNMKSHLIKVIDSFLTGECEYRKQKHSPMLNNEGVESVTVIQPEIVNDHYAA